MVEGWTHAGGVGSWGAQEEEPALTYEVTEDGEQEKGAQMGLSLVPLGNGRILKPKSGASLWVEAGS